ncbi:MAG: transposase [Bacteroidetes bacterium]|nr:transposase [Bacteroidota bacterium]
MGNRASRLNGLDSFFEVFLFHVAKCLGNAVDKVRRQEHKELRKSGNQILTGSKYMWLKSPPNMSIKQKQAFQVLRTSTLRTARA